MPVYVADMGSQNPVNFKLLAATECEGVIHRATRSNEETDQLYHVRRDVWRGLGKPWGGYGFNTGETVAVQTKRLLDYAQFSDDESAWLDLERNPSGGQMTLAMTIEFLDRMDQARGRRCGLYSGNVIKALIPGVDSLTGKPVSIPATDAQREFLAAHPLWGCEYGPRWRNVDANGRALPWPAPFLDQYTGDGVGPEPHTLDGLESGADLSLFNGTADQLRAAWALPAIIPAGAAA